MISENIKNTIIGALIALLSWFCLATTNTLVKLMNHTISPLQILFFQNVFGVLFIVFIYYFFSAKKNSLVVGKRYDLLFIRALAGLLTFFFMFISLKHVSVADATLLMNTGPLFLPFLLLLFFQEPIYSKLWLGIVPGFLGIILILKPGTEIFQWYTALPLLSGLGVAVIFISLRRLFIHKEPVIRIIFYLFLFGAVISLPFAIYLWKNPTLHEWGLLAAISVVGFFSQTAITIALRFASPKALAPLCYTSVLFALMYDDIFWHLIPDTLSIVGMILIIIGGVTALFVENVKKNPAMDAS